MLLRQVVERIANGGVAGFIVAQIRHFDVGIETWLARRHFLAVSKCARHVMGVLGRVVEMKSARLVAEVVDADRKHVQHRAGRLGASGLGLHLQTRHRDVLDAESVRGFKCVENVRQRVWPMQLGDG